MALAVQLDRNGTLEAVAGSWQYANGSAIHGLALGGRDKQVLYAADLRGDAIWTHRLGRDGKARRLGRFGVKAGSHPRHLASHPQGRRLYAVMEAQNSVVEFAVDAGVAGLPGTGVVTEMVGDWSLIPEGT
jgi:carboxy-cis,cis-muconate cyclase